MRASSKMAENSLSHLAKSQELKPTENIEFQNNLNSIRINLKKLKVRMKQTPRFFEKLGKKK